MKLFENKNSSITSESCADHPAAKCGLGKLSGWVPMGTPKNSVSVIAPLTEMDATPRSPTPTDSEGVMLNVMVKPVFV